MIALPFPVSSHSSDTDIIQPQIIFNNKYENLDDTDIDATSPKNGNPKLDSALNKMVNNPHLSMATSFKYNESRMEESTVRVIVE